MNVEKNINNDGVELNNRFALSDQEVKELEKQLEELKNRWPAHSAPPSMWMELERLEEELAQARARAKEWKENG